MRSRSIPLIFVATSLALAFTGCGPANKEKEPPKPKVADVAPAAPLPVLGLAPAWKLKDVNGREISSDQFKGKVVVLDFWATWCVPCKSEIPGYIELTKKYGPEGLAIVGVSTDQAGPQVVKEFIAKSAMNYQVVMADENIMSAFPEVEVIPTTIIIDRVGQIRDRKIGAEETAVYAKKILAVLKN